MKARVGDMIVIRGHHQGEPDRKGEIIEVHGEAGGPPFVVRWDDSGHDVLVFPGPDAAIETVTDLVGVKRP
ncbi:MAG TPA: DUF1918 domain-containing protein [Acidimicrobiales bacterium]|nr:DUF1918 domain-containing protein [Acidimicrobiales bacterium]